MPQPNLLYKSGEIASEKTLAMTRTARFDGTLRVVMVQCMLLLRHYKEELAIETLFCHCERSEAIFPS
ncbi:MAG: hypothetical protein U0586_05005 [Candidatus Brocadiaceae bacterium]